MVFECGNIAKTNLFKYSICFLDTGTCTVSYTHLDCDQRIIVTTFASNVHRIQQVINSAAKYGRKVGVTGRSMENIMRVATELGYICLLYTSRFCAEARLSYCLLRAVPP